MYSKIEKVKIISPQQIFILSVIIVNGGNYLYNLLLGRILGPAQFADAAILITLLLVTSFVAMTFQLTVTKFITEFTGSKRDLFLNRIKGIAIAISLIIGGLIALFANFLQEIFQTSSAGMFVVFAAGVPVYFLMSVNRGIYQGNKDFMKLAGTYQGEMLSRLLLTLAFLLLIGTNTSLLVAIGILFSLFVGLVPFQKTGFSLNKKVHAEELNFKPVANFIFITAFYEFTQIIINNSDILLVKHYFEPGEAGLYASLALIGRVVYFVAWMFVMILLPTVVHLRKQGKNTTAVFLRYISYVGALAVSIVALTFFYPQFIVSAMFGEAYLSIAPLLWKYAVATSLFAVSNVFVYYFLSLDKYAPVVISGLLGSAQVASIVLFHQSLAQVVNVQIILMTILLVIQTVFFLLSQHKDHSSTVNYQQTKILKQQVELKDI